LLSELGVVDKIEFIQQKNLYRIVVPGKIDINLKAERAAAEETLMEKFHPRRKGSKSFLILSMRFAWKR